MLPLLFLILAGAPAPALPALPAAPTVQQLFDHAAAAIDSGNPLVGLDDYQTIEKRLANSKGKYSLALVKLRKGDALMRLDRDEEAMVALTTGLTLIEGLPDPSGEAATGLLLRGQIEEGVLDFAAARRDYESARDRTGTLSANGRIRAEAGITRTAMFDDPAAALAAVDDAIATSLADATVGKPLRAQLRSLRGRVLLNQQKYALARDELKKAVGELGGLTSRVDIADITARSDTAIASLLSGNADDARKYLAFTGAGLKDVDLPPSVDNDLPPCGGEADLKPEDVAVVQFSIGDDGAVGQSSPIYASRSGPMALVFARAVSEWSWTAESVRKIDPFFRRLVRLELRCSTSSARPALAKLLMADSQTWLQTLGVEDEHAQSPAQRASAAHATLAKSANGPARLAAEISLAGNPIVPRDERRQRLIAARSDAATGHAPPAFQGALAILTANLEIEGARGGRRAGFDTAAGVLRSALADPVMTRDPRTRAALKLELASRLVAGAQADEIVPLLRSVAEDDALSRQDSLRVGALVRLATAQANAGDLASARATFAKTGLDEQQCALVDATPVMTNSPGSGGDFPDEALAWGFAGWVQTEFDIGADGKTLNLRAVVAYPPFVFGKAANGLLARARFTQSYRPNGSIGCGGSMQRVRFSIPGR